MPGSVCTLYFGHGQLQVYVLTVHAAGPRARILGGREGETLDRVSEQLEADTVTVWSRIQFWIICAVMVVPYCM
jgi:hypothetical protein